MSSCLWPTTLIFEGLWSEKPLTFFLNCQKILFLCSRIKKCDIQKKIQFQKCSRNRIHWNTNISLTVWLYQRHSSLQALIRKHIKLLELLFVLSVYFVPWHLQPQTLAVHVAIIHVDWTDATTVHINRCLVVAPCNRYIKSSNIGVSLTDWKFQSSVVTSWEQMCFKCKWAELRGI